MKTTRLLGVSLLATTTFLGACGGDDDDDNGTGPTNTATVRFVNTTGQNIDVGMNGTYGAGNSNVAFGSGTSCMTVNTASPGLTFRQNGQATTFTPTGFNTSALQAGGTYTVVLGGTTGAYTGRTFTDTYTGASATQGGVRVINATTGASNYGLYVGPSGTTRPSTATATTFGAGTASNWVPLNTGNGQVWLTTGSGNAMTNAFTSAAFPVTANGYTTMVVADPASGSTMMRGFNVAACR